ncbi:MAG: apolipoprotein N-acyltransferase [Kineosporiaceae bacterium]
MTSRQTDLLVRAVGASSAGAVLACAFPGIAPAWLGWALAPLGLAGAAAATIGRGPRAGALLGLLTGITFFLVHLHWTGIYVGALPWLALTALQALFFVVPGAVSAWAWRRGPGRWAALTVASWTLEEALRARIPFGGFPWGRLAFSQADSPLLGWAWLGGAPLVSAATAALGALVLLGARGAVNRHVGRAGALGGAVAALALLAGGPACAAASAATAESAGQTRVAAVQGNVPEPGLDFNAERRAVLDNHVRATLDLARRVDAGTTPRPDVVLWPENSSDIDPLSNPDAAAVITRAADAVGVPVLVGAVVDGPGRYLSNTAVLWGPSDGPEPGPGARYVKRHPAPFAEYIPARAFFRQFSDKVDLVSRDFTAGRTVGALPVATRAGGLTLGDVICFEVAYDGLVQDPVRAGADLVVVQTNNATFGFTDESVQQLAMSRLRAVETGRSVVHVSTVGVSALVRPDGSTVVTSGLFEPAVLEADLELRRDLTPAVRMGAWVEVALLALLGLAALPRRRVLTASRRDASAEGSGTPVAVASAS